MPRLSEQSSNAFDLVHPCLPFFHILSGLDFTLAQQGCEAISCDQQVIWFKFRQVARCFPGIQPLLPWIICNISLNIHQQGSPSLSTSSMKLTLQKLCYGSYLNLDVIVAHDSKLAHQNQWLQLVYPDVHVFLQFLSIKSDKKKSQSTSPGSSRVCGSAVRKKVAAVKPSLLAVSFAFAKLPTAIEPNFWKKKSEIEIEKKKQGCLDALHWLYRHKQETFEDWHGVGCVPIAFQGIDFGWKKRHEFDLLLHCIVLQLVVNMRCSIMTWRAFATKIRWASNAISLSSL